MVSPELSWPPEKGDAVTPIIWDTFNIASAEWENTSMRYRRMQEHLRSTKSFVGRPPFGYRIVGEAKSKTLEIDPVQAAALTEVVEMYLAGKSLRQLCAYLDAQGTPTRRGGAWVSKTLSEVFRNPVIAGRRIDGNGRTILRVPPILDMDTWRKLQAELDRKASRKGVAQAGSYLLAGVAVWGKCGGPMYRVSAYNTRKDGSKQYNFYYRCWGTPAKPSTCKNLFPVEELEARVERYMTVTMARWPRYETVIVPGHWHEEDIYEVERDLRELDFDDPDFSTKQAELLAERARLRALPATLATVERRPTGDTIGQYWATLQTDADKRAFLLRLALVVRVRRGKSRADDRVQFEAFAGSVHPGEFTAGGDVN